MTHRYYNPNTGKFLTRDPIGYEGGVNVYAYTRNNPVNRSDPSGFDWDWDWLDDWHNGAFKFIWDTGIRQVFGVRPLQQLGFLKGWTFDTREGTHDWQGYHDMDQYFGIITAMSMQPEFSFSDIIPAASSKLSRPAMAASKSPCFVVSPPGV